MASRNCGFFACLEAGQPNICIFNLLREIADLQTDDDGDVILGADANGHDDLLSRIASFLATHDR